MESFYYWGPALRCRNEKADPQCRTIIPLPYAAVRSSERIDGTSAEFMWPADGWRETFGCTNCGRVLEYLASHYHPQLFPTQTAGTFQPGMDCYRVDVSCPSKGCNRKASMYVSGVAEDRVRQLLSEGFFIWEMPCGHSLLPLQEKSYRISRITEPIGEWRDAGW
jgi:hypothetical protein